jgi:ubiquinol-cytochrome c reductase cytochrome c subunit
MQPRRHEGTNRTYKFKSSWFRVFVVAFVLAGRFGVEAGQAPRSATAENGKRLFMSYYCYACHGTEGQGGVGPRLVARATPDSLIRYVRKPSGIMPAYTSKVISEQDLRDIHAYLRSVPASPPARNIPILNW